jgi:hypothetical protein
MANDKPAADHGDFSQVKRRLELGDISKQLKCSLSFG